MYRIEVYRLALISMTSVITAHWGCVACAAESRSVDNLDLSQDLSTDFDSKATLGGLGQSSSVELARD